MKSTEILKGEHRVIEDVLDCLDRIVDRALIDRYLPEQPANEAIRFLRGFADGCHHRKEEDLLFPLLERRGFSPNAGPTAVMRAEHEFGREHIREMTRLLPDAAAGGDGALRSFADHAHAYTQLLRDHIAKEDHCLFPMADRTLSRVDQEKLQAEFERVEMEDAGPDAHDELLRLAADLRHHCEPLAANECR